MQMEITEIPFVSLVGIQQGENGRLMLGLKPEVANHLGTLHAGAQFLLAETASGEHLRQAFPDLAGKVIPLLRSSALKFKRPAESVIAAHPALSEAERAAFLEQFARKGRGTIAVHVDVKDADGGITCQGTYEWFVQRLPDESVSRTEAVTPLAKRGK